MADQTIFKRLKKDHETHRTMLDKIEKASGSERMDLFKKFRVEVTAHAAAEEETLYSTMLEDPELRHDGQHSVAEHHELDELMEEIEGLEPDSDEFKQKFFKLRHDYLHHIDEEEDDMFPEAKEELSSAEANKLGDKFKERKPAELKRAEDGVDMGDDRE